MTCDCSSTRCLHLSAPSFSTPPSLLLIFYSFSAPPLHSSFSTHPSLLLLLHSSFSFQSGWMECGAVGSLLFPSKAQKWLTPPLAFFCTKETIFLLWMAFGSWQKPLLLVLKHEWPFGIPITMAWFMNCNAEKRSASLWDALTSQLGRRRVKKWGHFEVFRIQPQRGALNRSCMTFLYVKSLASSLREEPWTGAAWRSCDVAFVLWSVNRSVNTDACEATNKQSLRL